MRLLFLCLERQMEKTEATKAVAAAIMAALGIVTLAFGIEFDIDAAGITTWFSTALLIITPVWVYWQTNKPKKS